VNSHTKEFISL